MKTIIKNVYMLFFHWRVLLLSKKVGKNFFLGRYSDVNKYKYLEIDDNVRIGNFARINFYDKFHDQSYQPSLKIGENTYIGNHFTVLCTDEIVIEKNVLFASYITITSENHGMDPEHELRYSKQALTSAPVKIEQGAWIGEKVSIMPGVTIGEKSIIGTGSVVTKDIPPYSIAAGMPAKVIKKYNFDKHSWEKVK